MSDSGNATIDESTRNLIGRIRGSNTVRWVLLRGGRGIVAAVILVGMAVVVFVALGAFSPSLTGERMRWLFNGLVNGLLSLVTVVLTINQLILSRQFGSPRDLYDRLEKRIDFRQEVESETGSVIAASQPGGFMQLLFQALRGEARGLETAATDRQDDRTKEAIDDYTETIVEGTNEITADLESQPFEMAGVLSVLNYDDSWQFHATRQLKIFYGDRLSEAQREHVESIEELLRQIDTTRQYFKTLYIQRELAQLSRQVVYVGVPALLVASLMIMVYRNGWSLSLGPGLSLAAMSVAIAITLSPVALLFAYALRFATVARRTVVFGPFTPQEEQERDSDWNL